MGELDIDTAFGWRGRTVVDRDGEKIGTLTDIYLDEEQRPHWGAVRTGLLRTRETLFPLDEARPDGDDVLSLPFARDRVLEAPDLDPDVEITGDDEQRLRRHYGLAAASEHDEVGARAAQDEPDRAAEADDAMTRSEEEVQFHKRPRARTRARLKKYVVTDYVEKKVPVQREEVKVEYEPADEDD